MQAGMGYDRAARATAPAGESSTRSRYLIVPRSAESVNHPHAPTSAATDPTADPARASLRWRRRLVRLCFGVFIGLVLSELALRLLLLQERVYRVPRLVEDAPFIQESDNPILYYEHVADTDVSALYVRNFLELHSGGGGEFEQREVEVKTRINRHGFRGADWSTVPDEGSVRIALLGDSQTYARRLNDEETPDARLAHHLSEQFPGVPFDVLNFGVGGYNCEQEYELLRGRVLEFKPDLVVLNYVSNDPQIDVKAALLYATTANPLSRLMVCRFLRFQLLWGGRTVQEIGPHERYSDYLLELYDSPFWDATRTIVREMQRTCDEVGVGFAVVIVPEIIQISSFDSPGDTYGPIYAKIESLQQDGIDVVNPHSALQATGVPPELLRVTDDDWHLGAFAVDRIAADVAGNPVIKELINEALDTQTSTQTH